MQTTRQTRSKQVLLYMLLYLASALYISLGITRALNIYDEGLILFGAQRVMWGEVPYRDFWTVYSPGQYYALGALFRLFGPTVLTARIWDTLFRAALALVCFSITRRLSTTLLALASWGLVTIWIGFYEFYGYPIYIALFLVLTSVRFLLHLSGTARPRWCMLAAGATLGLAAVFRHDFGVYGLAAELAVFIPYALLVPGVLPQKTRLRGLLRLLNPFLFGFAILVVPVLVLLLTTVPASLLWQDLVVFPLTIFPQVRALPYPELLTNPSVLEQGLRGVIQALPQLSQNWPYYMPYVVGAAALVYLLARLVSARWRKLTLVAAERFSGYAYILLFAAASINQARIRADLIHLAGLLVTSFILLFALVGVAWRNWKPLGLLAAVCCFFMLMPYLETVANERQQLFRRGIWANTPNTNHQIAAAKGMPVEHQQAAAVRYIQSALPEDVPLYVGNSRHDRIFVNDALFYFLAGRKSATRYHELHPGVATTQQVQEEIVADLERHRVPLVVISNQFEHVTEPNESGVSSNVRIVDIFLNRYYRAIVTFDPHYTVLARQPG